MVEIREETSTNSNQNENAEITNNAGTSSNTHRTIQTLSIVDFLKQNAMDTICFVLRVLTVFFAIQYHLPTTDQEYTRSVYFKAFAAGAATNALRLYHRLKGVNVPIVSQQFLQTAMAEDSAHYLLYCITFPMSTPVSMALIPIVFYAFFNSIPFLSKMAEETGHGTNAIVRKLADIRVQQADNILGLIACAEIFNFPIFFAMIFTGRGNIFFPVLYFRFLTLRYASRRNPYTRIAFASLKQSLNQVAASSRCPAFVRTIIFKSIGVVERFAPPVLVN
uniref:Transmembrane protein 33 n=1 Tax=Panagrolaimus sp. ES5 TaxID=591445 RepID=A0AC34G3W1_9BILA